MTNWTATELPNGVARFFACEYVLRVTPGDRLVFASIPGGDVFALPGLESLVLAGRRRRGGLDPQQACCVVAGRRVDGRRVRRTAARARRWARALQRRPFSPFPRISGLEVGSGLSARDWRAYC